MTTVFHGRPYGRFIDIQSNLRRLKFDKTNQGSNFLGDSFSNRDYVIGSIQLRRKSQPQHLKRSFLLKTRPIHFHINSNSVFKPIKRNQFLFFSIQINKPLLAPIYNVSQIRFKFSWQFQLLPKIRCLIMLRVESSIIKIDSNITVKIRIVINQQQEGVTQKFWKDDFLRELGTI